MNLILFSIFAIGIICIMSGYYSDKISQQSNTTIKYIPQYSELNNPNIGSNLHDFYNTTFNDADRWTGYPYAYAEQGLEFPKMKSISHTQFMNKRTWPNLPKDVGAPVYDINKKLLEKSCNNKCFQENKKSEGKGRDNSKFNECKRQCMGK